MYDCGAAWGRLLAGAYGCRVTAALIYREGGPTVVRPDEPKEKKKEKTRGKETVSVSGLTATIWRDSSWSKRTTVHSNDLRKGKQASATTTNYSFKVEAIFRQR